MDFAHYTDAPVALAVELVNTFGWASGTETLSTVDDLNRFVQDSGVWADEAPTAKPGDLADIRDLRLALRDIFEAEDPHSAADRINDILASSDARPHLSTHGGPAHLHFEPFDASLPRWLGVVTAMGLATVLADKGVERLGVCQSETCNDVYVDTSRNRSRRHCSVTCGTRENVAAHRQRQRQDP